MKLINVNNITPNHVINKWDTTFNNLNLNNHNQRIKYNEFYNEYILEKIKGISKIQFINNMNKQELILFWIKLSEIEKLDL